MVNLLIADDESIIRQGLLSIPWEELDVHVVADVNNGLEAVEILQGELIDIVLTDIRMPGMDGLELAQFIHENGFGTKVILLSGYHDFEYARSAIQYDVMDYILKPSNPEEIVKTIKKACKEVGRRREADMRIQLLEAELGKRQLIYDKDNLVLGQVENSSVADQILCYIKDHYKEHISLSSLSDRLHFSTIYLSKVIKKSVDYSFLEIVNAMRIYDAAAQLRDGKNNLTEICLDICINDPRYFSQMFKKYYGVTPSAYKKTPCMPLDTKLAYLVQSLRSGRL